MQQQNYKKYKFKQSLNLGKIAENKIIELFQEFGDVEVHNNIEHDLLIKSEPEFTIEVKNDIMSNKTGNIAIEFFNTRLNKDSGINASSADYWIYYLNEKEIYLIKLVALKEFCNNNKPLRIITSGGDNNASFYLYRKDDILKVFSNISGLKKNQIQQLL